MSAAVPLKVVLCWHMHQPYYFDHAAGEFQLPWSYLHAIKDYQDMAAILEATPGARAVINFAPTLLEQLDRYDQELQHHLQRGGALSDPLLAALAGAALPTEPAQREQLLAACLKINQERLMARFPLFRQLGEIALMVQQQPLLLHYLEDQLLIDLLVWYHLAWIGETIRRDDQRIQQLMARGRDYTLADRQLLVTVISEIMASLLPRYRALAESGRIELSMTPYAHPIVPLLLDFNSAHETQPQAPLPRATHYPGGAERAQWHIDEGRKLFRHYFGQAPAGCWPAEGGISEAALALYERAGFHWVASGESVLHHSLQRGHVQQPHCIHRPYRYGEGKLNCFFRDDGLSDLIGFTYANWHGDDAVNNLIHHLENIASACRHDPDRVVPIILDGENAWEYYPENGYHFLTALYRRLADHPSLQLTTFSDALASGIKSLALPHICAGSWVYGSFSTWIGDPEKNRAWDLLVEAKQLFDRVRATGRLKGRRLHRVARQLAICEGSDWFWWFGDYNPAGSVRDFDRLYRLQLAELYRLLEEPIPAAIGEVISHGGSAATEAGGVMRRGREG